MEKKRYGIIYTFQDKHWWYQGRKKLLLKIIQNLPLGPNRKILDYGCGAGHILTALQPVGTTYGVDVEPLAINFCRQKGLKNLFLIKKNNKLPFAKNYFDLIVCLDVLEHIEDDGFALEQIQRCLKPGGSLALFLPAFPILWSNLDVKSHHYRRYTKADIVNKLKTTKLVPQSVNYFNFIFFLPILLIRLIQKTSFLRNNNWGMDPKIENSLVNEILKSVFYFDIFLSRHFPLPFGVSLYIISQKPVNATSPTRLKT